MPDLRERPRRSSQLSENDWERLSSGVESSPSWLVHSCSSAPREFELPFMNGQLQVKCDGPRPAWLPYAVAKLEELAALKSNWNSYGALPVRRSCLVATVELLADVMFDHSPNPAIVPTTMGSVQLEWHRKGIDLEIEVLGPGRFHVVAVDSEKGTEWESEVGSDLTDIVSFVRRLT